MSSYLEALDKLTNVLKQEGKKEKLKTLEEKIFKDEQALMLIKAFKASEDDYNFMLNHFEHDNELIAKYKNILIEKKRAMDTYPLIKEYNDLYLDITSSTLYLEEKLKEILIMNEEKSC